jgi:hypothetical protein
MRDYINKLLADCAEEVRTEHLLLKPDRMLMLFGRLLDAEMVRQSDEKQLSGPSKNSKDSAADKGSE